MAVNQDGIPSGHSTTDYLTVLDDAHRRTVVSILATIEAERSVPLSSLADAVAAEIEDVERDIRHTEIELHHTHLPKLDEVGLIDYWSETQCIIPTDEVKTAKELVETVAAK